MKLNKKVASVAISALVLAGLAVGAAPAQADVIPGTITITPTSGNVSDQYFLQSIGTSVGAPVGYRAASTNQIFQNGVLVGNMSNLRTTSMAVTAGTNGLDGNPAFMDRSIIGSNNFVSNKQLNSPLLQGTPLQTGNFELRYYFHALSTSLDLVNDKYLTMTLYYDAATGNWGPPAAPATPTTTSLSATTTAAAGEVALSAAVKNAGGTVLTAAPGSIVFKEGATTVATVPVAAGLASTTLTGVANGSHVYTATYVPTGTAYATSTSATATVQLGSLVAPVTGAPSNITVAIPTGVGNLYLTSYSASVDLGTAVRNGSTLDASGTFYAVVTDERQLDYPEWNLKGQIGDFTKVGAPTTVLDGKYLGWTPAVAPDGVAIGSTPGPVVAPAPASTGLKVVSLLAKGQPNAANTVTSASALLLLKAPTNTPAGQYNATLTLTLI